MQTKLLRGLAVAALACAAACPADVRPPAVAGAFYERMPVALQVQVDGLLRAAASPPVTGRLVAAVAPHAGYVYSGRCAAGVYRLLTTGQVSRVILLAPSHRAAFAGVSLPAAALTAYRTPLGDVPVDQEACAALRGKPGFTEAAGADRNEHAIEVHLPLLQRAAGAFRLVPLICGAMDAETVAAVAGALSARAGAGTLLVASSDFTHYGPQYDFVPFSADRETTLKAWLADAASRIALLDPAGFDRHCRETHDTICGQNPIRVLMAVLQGTDSPRSWTGTGPGHIGRRRRQPRELGVVRGHRVLRVRWIRGRTLSPARARRSPGGEPAGTDNRRRRHEEPGEPRWTGCIPAHGCKPEATARDRAAID